MACKRKTLFVTYALGKDMGTRELIQECAKLMEEVRPGKKYPGYKVVDIALRGFKKHLQRMKAGGTE